MKYRKKPVVIEAVQWTGRNINEVHKFLGKGWENQEWDGNDFIIIPTLEGDHRADKGDFIIRGVQGEVYPCKPDIFEATYESVEDTE